LFVVGIYSVGPRLVGSLNRPSGNLTGVSLTGSVLAAKRIELLHELVPKTAAVIALMVNPTIPPPAEPQAADAETAARSRPGVVFAELGSPPPLCRGLFVLSRSVGALAHAFEEMQSGERNKGPIPRQLIWTYTGPPPRKLAGAAP
jgi:hypothetical protein